MQKIREEVLTITQTAEDKISQIATRSLELRAMTRFFEKICLTQGLPVKDDEVASPGKLDYTISPLLKKSEAGSTTVTSSEIVGLQVAPSNDHSLHMVHDRRSLSIGSADVPKSPTHDKSHMSLASDFNYNVDLNDADQSNKDL